MMNRIHGKAWIFGDQIDTDIIIPARHLVLPMEEMKRYAMEPVAPRFSQMVKEGDVIVAGKNFGCGSSREQAPAVLKALGLKAVIASSFARIFFRNAVNLGLPVIECAIPKEMITEGDPVDIDPAGGSVYLPRTDKAVSGTPLPGFLLDIVADGGLIAHLANRNRNG